MKAAVLRSIKPYWVFLIIARKMGWDVPQEKTIEVGKNKPSSADWNKQTYIYCSKDKKSFKRIPEQYRPFMKPLLGKVVGEFVCDRIEGGYWLEPWANYLQKQSCLTWEEINKYAKGGKLYGWHISNLKTYDTPKEISEFKRWNRTEENVPCAHVKWLYPPCNECNSCNLIRPPQSWQYIEEN